MSDRPLPSITGYRIENFVSPEFPGVDFPTVIVTRRNGQADMRPLSDFEAWLVDSHRDLLSATESLLALAEELRDEEAYLKMKSGLDALEEAVKKAGGEV